MFDKLPPGLKMYVSELEVAGAKSASSGNSICHSAEIEPPKHLVELGANLYL
jgi:hypothetical protein